MLPKLSLKWAFAGFLLLALVTQSFADPQPEHDLVIYGASPAGLMAGVAAAREGASVVVIEPTNWMGGMVAGGLSRTDKGKESTIGGLAREFFTRCSENYDPPVMWLNEPQVYQKVFAEMVAEAGFEVHTSLRLKSVETREGRIVSFTTADGRSWPGKVFIDATYEGDLMAKAGVGYTYGRESRDQYGEELAGYHPNLARGFSQEVMASQCACVGGEGPHYVHGSPGHISALDSNGEPLPGIVRANAEPGSADRYTQSYNFRLCVTQDPDLLVPWPKPKNYRVEDYALLLRLIETYPGIPFGRIVHLGELTNGKYDLNAQGLFSTDFVGANTDYPDGDYTTRDRIWQEHVDYVQGLFWFLSHDERVPEALRQQTQSWGLCRDEFKDNGHFSYHLYVREARRMVGAYVMTQEDVQRKILKEDGVGMGSFVIDSHIVQRVVDSEGNVIDEGAFDGPARTYQMPYRCITPKQEECENLLVPVCLSASHVAYCTIRMEPVYMAMGHSAGLAAVQAIASNQAVQEIDVAQLQAKLGEQKQVMMLKGMDELLFLEDLEGIVVDDQDAEFTAFWQSSPYGNPIDGGARHDANASKGEAKAVFTVQVPKAGKYEVRMSYPSAPNRATNVPVSLKHAGGVEELTVDQTKKPPIDGIFLSLGTFTFGPETPAVVTVRNEGTDGFVGVDTIQLLPVE